MVEILESGERILHTLESYPDQKLVLEAKAFVNHIRVDILNQLRRKLRG